MFLPIRIFFWLFCIFWATKRVYAYINRKKKGEILKVELEISCGAAHSTHLNGAALAQEFHLFQSDNKEIKNTRKNIQKRKQKGEKGNAGEIEMQERRAFLYGAAKTRG
ncbi:hypothetical protein L6164_006964 [Bauhinia variegata]|uniref:Uncharacterized protein n=1 Tax=Bauhinia variegata TaxID=167791 RepID=A0ACB9PW68_BAUVA|nr:hypothetical protein L6164_006964 [Bauhinia variegata]